MGDTDRLLREFIDAFERDRTTDPSLFLTRATPADRAELAALIDGYLERAPRRRWDPQAFAASAAARATADDLAQSLEGVAGTWPVLLPRLRNQAQLKRGELVAQLAAALDVADREEKVGSYYHAMEQGLLEPSGVSERVLAALAKLTATTVDTLRAAGRALSLPSPPSAGSPAAFARTATPDAAFAASAPPPPASPGQARSTDAWDEVDELFRGG